MRVDPAIQQPCTHCGDCARSCPEALNPEVLFFALVNDAWPAMQEARLDACTECNRCTEVCPSRIPLQEWLLWGKSELRQQAAAAALRARFVARNARLARAREERASRHVTASPTSALPVQSISKSEVLAAIARGKAKIRTRLE